MSNAVIAILHKAISSYLMLSSGHLLTDRLILQIG